MIRHVALLIREDYRLLEETNTSVFLRVIKSRSWVK